MKALQKSPISPEHALEARLLHAPHFDPSLHFHPEYQLFTVLEGTGTRIIGDRVQPFRKGDVVFTGPNLPHVWRSDREYFKHNSELSTAGIVIYFHENLVSDGLIKTNEAYRIRQLFTHSRCGMCFFGQAADQIVSHMRAVLYARDFDRIILMFQLFDILSSTQEYQLLATTGYTNNLKDADTKRMNDVHEYVLHNFSDKISLDGAAALANMTTTSFSRYFKVHANTTFSDFVSEIRIGHACKLLATDKISVAQIASESGYLTMSNFNRQFKSRTGYSPLEYRQKFTEL
jgi:AraC-like DNA-binding protein/quercetin dioxygenase-like cupin family protein